MLGFGYAYKGFYKAAATCAGFRLSKPPVVLDMPGAWLAGLVGESARRYYSDFRVQRDVRRRAGAILREAAGLGLSNCLDFGGIAAGSMFGGEITLGDAAAPALSPVLNSPKDVTSLAVKIDASSLEETGLIPQLFTWRHQLRQQERGRMLFAMRIPGVVTLAEQVCGRDLYGWVKSHPDRMFDLAGVLRRALIRLARLIRSRTSAPMPVLILEDPAMGKLDPEVFHEIFWRATRSVVYSLASFKLFTWYLAPGAAEGHIQYIGRLRARVAQVGETASLEYIRSNLRGSILLGHVPAQTLRDGNPAQVRDIANACAEKARALGLPLFLSPSGAVELGTPLENIAAFVNVQ